MLVECYLLTGNVEKCLLPVLSGEIEPSVIVLSEDCEFSVKARMQLINEFVVTPRLAKLTGVVSKKMWPLVSVIVAKIARERQPKFSVDIHVAGGLPPKDEMDKFNAYVRDTTDFEVDISMRNQ
jgi:hypothetical protein